MENRDVRKPLKDQYDLHLTGLCIYYVIILLVGSYLFFNNIEYNMLNVVIKIFQLSFNTKNL